MTDLAPFLPGFAAAYAILAVAASSPGPAVAILAGVGLILAQAAWAMTAIRLVGAAYLAWLAWGAFRKVANPPTPVAAQVIEAPAWRHFAAGLLLQLTNPEAIVFWIAIASIGATAGGGASVVAAFLIGAFAISFGLHGAWALLLSARPVRAAYGKARRWIEGTLGTFFAYAAFRLATDRS